MEGEQKKIENKRNGNEDSHFMKKAGDRPIKTKSGKKIMPSGPNNYETANSDAENKVSREEEREDVNNSPAEDDIKRVEEMEPPLSSSSTSSSSSSSSTDSREEEREHVNVCSSENEDVGRPIKSRKKTIRQGPKAKAKHEIAREEEREDVNISPADNDIKRVEEMEAPPSATFINRRRKITHARNAKRPELEGENLPINNGQQLEVINPPLPADISKWKLNRHGSNIFRHEAHTISLPYLWKYHVKHGRLPIPHVVSYYAASHRTQAPSVKQLLQEIQEVHVLAVMLGTGWVRRVRHTVTELPLVALATEIQLCRRNMLTADYLPQIHQKVSDVHEYYWNNMQMQSLAEATRFLEILRVDKLERKSSKQRFTQVFAHYFSPPRIWHWSLYNK